MPLVLPNEGLPDWLDWTIRHTGSDPPDLIAALFVNDLTPDAGTVFADMIAASFGGFYPLALTRAGWTVPVVFLDVVVSTWGSVPHTWTATSGGQTVYGWFAWNPDTMRLQIA